MKYKEALETVEQWLEKRGIRQFCRTACKGACCVPHEVNCPGKDCKRPPLLCAMYLCDEMRKILFGFHAGERYRDFSSTIEKIIADAKYDPMGITDVDIDLEIPDELIKNLLSVPFERDIHY